MQADVKKAYEYLYYIKKKFLEIALACGKDGCHIGGNMSASEILAVLYSNFIHFYPEVPTHEQRDRFFPSKAHCIYSQACALVKKGIIKEEDIMSIIENDGKFCGKPTNSHWGFEFSGGSLGMGLSLGIGTALSAKRKNYNYKTYVLLGDGECDEGSVWEGVMAASHFKLDNLVAIIDRNNLQNDGHNNEIMNLENFEAKFKAFGWDVKTINGHSIEELIETLSIDHKEKPMAIIAKTVKANGVERYKDKAESHFAELTKEDYNLAINELKSLEGKWQ